jgi:hypothetical protein
MTSDDLSDPIEIVSRFIAVMNLWEQKANALAEAARNSEDPGSYWPEVHAGLEDLSNLLHVEEKAIWSQWLIL